MDWLCSPMCTGTGWPCDPEKPYTTTPNRRGVKIDAMLRDQTVQTRKQLRPMDSDSPVGVGIVVKKSKREELFNGLTILAVVPGGAASESGQVSAGMQLITVDGQDIRGWKLDEVMPKLLGPAGSSVDLEFLQNLNTGNASTIKVRDPNTRLWVFNLKPSTGILR